MYAGDEVEKRLAYLLEDVGAGCDMLHVCKQKKN
jgi:hypothetical protein